MTSHLYVSLHFINKIHISYLTSILQPCILQTTVARIKKVIWKYANVFSKSGAMLQVEIIREFYITISRFLWDYKPPRRKSGNIMSKIFFSKSITKEKKIHIYIICKYKLVTRDEKWRPKDIWEQMMLFDAFQLHEWNNCSTLRNGTWFFLLNWT